MVVDDIFIEVTQHDGMNYGITTDAFDQVRADGRIPVIVATPSGALQVKAFARENGDVHISVFLSGNHEKLIERFVARALISASPPAYGIDFKALASRIAKIPAEMKWVEIYRKSLGWDVEAEFGADTEGEVITSIMEQCGIIAH
jgi:hypothetical protein